MEQRTRKRPAQINQRARSLRDAGNLAEALLWGELKARKLGGYKFVRQQPIGPYFADFLCHECRLVVEVDGSQHADSDHDRRRDHYMRCEGYSVIRFWNIDVIKEREGVCRTILAALEGRFANDVAASDLRFAASYGRKE